MKIENYAPNAQCLITDMHPMEIKSRTHRSLDYAQLGESCQNDPIRR